MADSPNQRNLPATPRKIEKARADGQVARSRDLGHFAALGLGVALLGTFLPDLTRWCARLLGDGLRFDAAELAHPAAMVERLGTLGTSALTAWLPIGLLSVGLALVAAMLAGGWNFTVKPLAPRLDKLNPLAGLQRMFAGVHLVDTLKACVLALALGGAGAWVLARGWAHAAEMLAMPLPRALHAAGAILQGGLYALGAVLALFALVDVPWQRLALQRRLRMSVDEVKREMREAEGNAEVKQRRRSRMRELANRRMLSAVPKADLVVMNPAHYAVALRYDEARMGAPRVVAKGADLVALRIRELAREAQVPVVQAPPLARALYAHAEIDQEIPARLFGAVAQVLAWVYQLREAMAQGRAFVKDAPQPDVPADMDPLSGAAPEPLRGRGAEA